MTFGIYGKKVDDSLFIRNLSHLQGSYAQTSEMVNQSKILGHSKEACLKKIDDLEFGLKELNETAEKMIAALKPAQKTIAETFYNKLKSEIPAAVETFRKRVSEINPGFFEIETEIEALKNIVAYYGFAPKSEDECETLRGRVTKLMSHKDLCLPAYVELLDMDEQITKAKKDMVDRALKELREVALTGTAPLTGPALQTAQLAIQTLPKNIAGKLYGKIWELAGKPQVPEFGSKNVLADLPRLAKALHALEEFPVKAELRALQLSLATCIRQGAEDAHKQIPMTLIGKLPERIQDLIYRKVVEKSSDPKKGQDPQFGKAHVFDNLLQLRDIIRNLPGFDNEGYGDSVNYDKYDFPIYAAKFPVAVIEDERPVVHDAHEYKGEPFVFDGPIDMPLPVKRRPEETMSPMLQALRKMSDQIDNVKKNLDAQGDDVMTANEKRETFSAEVVRIIEKEIPDPKIRTLIYTRVWEEHGRPEGDPAFGEHHVADDLPKLGKVFEYVEKHYSE